MNKWLGAKNNEDEGNRDSPACGHTSLRVHTPVIRGERDHYPYSRHHPDARGRLGREHDSGNAAHARNEPDAHAIRLLADPCEAEPDHCAALERHAGNEPDRAPRTDRDPHSRAEPDAHFISDTRANASPDAHAVLRWRRRRRVVHARPHADAHPDSFSHADAFPDTEPHAIADTVTDAFSEPDANSNADRDPHAQPDANANSNTHTNAHSDANTNADP